MDSNNYKISDAEFEVMRILWREERPVSFSDVRTELNSKMGWEKSTIATLIRRLVKKGAVSIQESSLLYAEYLKRGLYSIQRKEFYR